MSRWPLVLLLASCTVKLDYGGTRFRCDDGECPAGQVCVAGECHFQGDDAPIDSVPPVDAPPADASDALGQLVEDGVADP